MSNKSKRNRRQGKTPTEDHPDPKGEQENDQQEGAPDDATDSQGGVKVSDDDEDEEEISLIKKPRPSVPETPPLASVLTNLYTACTRTLLSSPSQKGSPATRPTSISQAYQVQITTYTENLKRFLSYSFEDISSSQNMNNQ